MPAYADCSVSPVNTNIVSHLKNFSMLFDMVQYNHVLNVNDRILDLVFTSCHCLMSKSLNSLLTEDADHSAPETHFRKLSVHAFNNFNKFCYNKS